MKLTSYTNYALRSLQMAALRAPALIRVDDVVCAHRISRPHVVKIIHELGKENLVETVRGRSGGFRLGRAADQITVGDVVRITEGTVNLVECFEPSSNTCPLIDVCILSRKMHEATKAFMDVLDGVTIADISANRGQLFEKLMPQFEVAAQ